ncbi:leucyl aminopeptidase (aminopeptidase T) [Solirubrobacter pauli]|uniref:Leucyl aminopeptidase (Aminopeptidase T) n=1 Tax=Solirubrobacter pauli TaxID=166793 RepID=A0A660LE32_9ACTN|nr:aminopeptidase [Solirubrobacter pauli]RKQ92839.1 leucyl aminopeptidase (aminopeptidase T) [Solirubrobacter pauli]
MTELTPAAVLAVEQLGVRAGERVAVLHNAAQRAIAAALADATRDAGAEVQVVEFATLERHGAEPPLEVAEAILRADACFAATDTSLSHTRARIAGTQRGGRFASLPTVTDDIFRRTIPIDYALMKRRGAAIADLITRADTVRITSPQGTDVTLVVRGRDGRNDDGDLREAGAFGNLPAGEAYVSPVEVEGDGVIVFDGSIAGYGLLKEPVEVVMAGGRLVSASGEAGAWLERMLDSGGDGGRRVAELGIGTNPAATLCGVVLEDEKLIGTAHIAFGSSAGIGGVVQSSVHIDSIMLEPTVEIAGETVVSGGRLVFDPT